MLQRGKCLCTLESFVVTHLLPGTGALVQALERIEVSKAREAL